MTVVETVEKVIEEQISAGRKKFMIYPYGPVGYIVKKVLEESFGLQALCVIDNYKYGKHSFIEKVDYLSEIDCKEITILLSTHNLSVLKLLKETLKPYENEVNIIDVFPHSIGKHSWGTLCDVNGYLIERIGAFCSFAEGCCVVSNHWKQGISTSALFNGIDLEDLPVFKRVSENVPLDKLMDNERCVIGNDVWFGRNVVVCNGAKVGNGVIAGAGAVITKDVPDYAVVGGVPAKIIKYRYTEEQIKKLNEIKWWNWSDEKIAETFMDFYNIDVFFEKHYKI
jgi:acetyltransferase-like isoleucine patch superfamily enzyme